MKEYTAPTIDIYLVNSEPLASDAVSVPDAYDPNSPWLPGRW